MLHTAVLLDSSVTAVMIGQYQSFCRDNLACAAATEVYYRIFQGYTAGIVYLLGRNQQTELRHGDFILLFEVGQHPHPFIGIGGKNSRCKE